MAGRARKVALIVGLASAGLAFAPLVVRPHAAPQATERADADPPPWEERLLGAPRPLADVVADLEAGGEAALARLIKRGRDLFDWKFTTEDGAGRPFATQGIIPTEKKRAGAPFQRTGGPDANACAGCHNDPVRGAAGEFAVNVFVAEGFESADFDSLDPQFSNERGSPALQGAGLVELLAREMSTELQAQRRGAARQARADGRPVKVALTTKGVAFGTLEARPDGTIDISKIEGVDPDLVVKPFSQKGVFVSLRQFTVNALNHHHGIQPTERWGARWTGTADHDRDGKPDEIGEADVAALVAFQATLPTPIVKTGLPAVWAQKAARGAMLFGDIGCASCHRPALPLESTLFEDPGPFDTAGTLRRADVAKPVRYDLARLPFVQALPRDDKGRVLVPLFGDLKRHTIADPRSDRLANELLAQRFVERNVFQTARLWGVGDTAPYGHRGDITTLDGVIRAHGGEGDGAKEAYEALPEADRQAIIAFMKTLTIAKAPEVRE